MFPVLDWTQQKSSVLQATPYPPAPLHSHSQASLKEKITHQRPRVLLVQTVHRLKNPGILWIMLIRMMWQVGAEVLTEMSLGALVFLFEFESYQNSFSLNSMCSFYVWCYSSVQSVGRLGVHAILTDQSNECMLARRGGRGAPHKSRWGVGGEFLGQPLSYTLCIIGPVSAFLSFSQLWTSDFTISRLCQSSPPWL